MTNKEFEVRYKKDKEYAEFVRQKELEEQNESKEGVSELLGNAFNSTDPDSPFVDFSGRIHPKSKLGKKLAEEKKHMQKENK